MKKVGAHLMSLLGKEGALQADKIVFVQNYNNILLRSSKLQLFFKFAIRKIKKISR